MEMTLGRVSAEDSDPRQLVLRIQTGEQDAEAELVRRYTNGVMIIIRRIARDPFLTDDLCQETFRLLIEKVRRGEVREPEKLSGYVCSLARNLAIDHVRSTRTTQTLEEAESSPALFDRAPGPLEALLEEEKLRAVRQVLTELAASRDREILHRFYIAEEDKEKICADLRLSSLHFNRVLYRARERFRELYEEGLRNNVRERGTI
jgi:RNA polymerase sigma-70 factor (ECF subfamily)